VTDAVQLPDLPDEPVRAFLAAFRAEPDSDVPRLIFADWLEERGDPRGEMIRLSCRLERLPPDSPEWPALEERLNAWRWGSMLEAWLGELPEPNLDILDVDRGLLVASVYAPWGDEHFREQDQPRFAACARQGWLGRVRFQGGAETFSMLAGGCWPTLLTADVLCLSAHRKAHIRDRDLAELPLIPNLVELDLGECHAVSSSGLAALHGCGRLESLELAGDELTDAGLVHLGALPGLQELRVFDAGALTDAGMNVLGCRMRGLRRLLLDGAQQVTDLGLRCLTALTELRELTLYDWPRLSKEAITEVRRALPRCRIKP
jgi:uncharacterized protein (TIGR02996 family)